MKDNLRGTVFVLESCEIFLDPLYAMVTHISAVRPMGGAEGAEQQSSGKADDDVVDAEFEEVKDDDKK